MGLLGQQEQTENQEDMNSQEGSSDTGINDSQENSSSNEPKWWLDEGLPGQGDRPSWLPEKYKSAKALADAYKSLEQKLGQAPDQYDWEAGKDWLDPDYEPFQEMADVARSHHVPQAVMDKMLSAVDKYLKEFQPDYTEERQKLGENAEQRLVNLENWIKANFSESSYKALTDNLKTAESIIALEELRDKMINNNTTIPNGNETNDATRESIEDIENDIANNLEQYKTDSNYRKQIQDRIAKAAGTGS